MKRKAHFKKLHVIAWYREQRNISQAQLATRLGVSRELIQKVESGKLPVSETLAFKLAGHSGIHPEWFIDNRLTKPLPDLNHPQRDIDRVLYSSKQYYHTHLAQRLELLRGYLFSRTIINELGVVGFHRCKFGDVLNNSLREHLACFNNRQARRWVGAKANACLRMDDEAVARFVIADTQEILRTIREQKPKGATP
jgi:transcriptional regulator with XRE-family HTH domain